MWTYYPELLQKPVPRYTSYPTAAEFSSAVGLDDLERALGRVSGDISVYIHIPFCEKICWYCGCNTGAASKRTRLASYLDSLEKEIMAVGRKIPVGAKVRRVAFGGGSPNAITPVDWLRIVQCLTVSLPLEDAEWSIELDPRTLSDVWQPALAHVGVRYASLGVQTFAPHLQEAIGRVQPDADIVRSTELLREAGVHSLNFDLMYGLPDQSRDDVLHSVQRAVELGADRIALFGYAHVPHIIPRQRKILAHNLPDQKERFAMAADGYAYLTDAGYLPVGFDHFAKADDPMGQAVLEGRLRRNFQGFTDDRAETLIGFGASAISVFPDLLVQNEKNTGRYRERVDDQELAPACGVARDLEDQVRGRIIADLLCQGRASIDPYVRADVYDGLQPFWDRGLVEWDGDYLCIPSRGLPYARTIAALFDRHRAVSVRQFSSAV